MADGFAQRLDAFLSEHTPSLTTDNDEVINYRLADPVFYGNEDLARRTCSCGKVVDGFYEYIDHLDVAGLERALS